MVRLQGGAICLIVKWMWKCKGEEVLSDWILEFREYLGKKNTERFLFSWSLCSTYLTGCCT